MRQKIRRTLLLVSFLLFPITIWYFSPYLILQAASEHIMNGSFLVFAAMLVLSMFFGRVWCGFFCPAGGLQECVQRINDKPAKQGKRDRIKYVIWMIWIVAIIATFIFGKNHVTVDPFYMTDHGISVSGIENYVIYYGVLLILLLPALIHGRRAACHYLCWMAPFMVTGCKLGWLLHVPQLRIRAKEEGCVSCGKCRTACPMSLDVPDLAKRGGINSAECILCGECAAACGKGVLGYGFGGGRNTR